MSEEFRSCYISDVEPQSKVPGTCVTVSISWEISAWYTMRSSSGTPEGPYLIRANLGQHRLGGPCDLCPACVTRTFPYSVPRLTQAPPCRCWVGLRLGGGGAGSLVACSAPLQAAALAAPHPSPHVPSPVTRLRSSLPGLSFQPSFRHALENILIFSKVPSCLQKRFSEILKSFSSCTWDYPQL